MVVPKPNSACRGKSPSIIGNAALAALFGLAIRNPAVIAAISRSMAKPSNAWNGYESRKRMTINVRVNGVVGTGAG
jgi:hypothetical protein